MSESKEKKTKKVKSTTVKEKAISDVKSAKEIDTNTLVKAEKKGKGKSTSKTLNASLTKKEQKYFRALSRIISVIAKILRVCSMILVPILIVVMIMVPFVFKDIEFNGNIIKFNNAKFILRDDSITLNIGDENYTIADNIKDMDRVLDFFYNNSFGKITAITLLSLGALTVSIIINIYVLQYIEKLFKNFRKNKTPFEIDNCQYIRNIGRIMIIEIIVALIFNVVISLLFKGIEPLNIKTFSITMIIVVYIAYFIFKYGTNMQSEIDTSIYD